MKTTAQKIDGIFAKFVDADEPPSPASAEGIVVTAPSPTLIPVKWWRPTRSAPTSWDGTEAGALALAAYGIRPNMQKGIGSPEDLEKVRSLCDGFHAATSKVDAETVLPGSWQWDTVVSEFAVMTGQTQGAPLIGGLRIELSPGADLATAISRASGGIKPGDPGVSGRP